jgi:SecD/SecF fusion protein
LSSRRSHLVLIALIVLALAGTALLAVPGSPAHKSLRKGLDLQGGLEVVLKAVPPKGHKLTSDDMSRSIEIMRNRIDKLGVASPEVREQGSNEIDIQLAGVHDPAAAAAIIGKTAQLELYDLLPALVPPSRNASQQPVPTRNLYDLLTRVQSSAGTKGEPEAYYLFAPKKKTTSLITPKKKSAKKSKAPAAGGWKLVGHAQTLHRDRTTGIAGVLDAHGGKVPDGYKLLTVPHGTVVISCTAQSAGSCPGDANALPPGVTDYYLFKHGSYPNDRYATDGKYPNMTGKDLDLSGTRQDYDPSTGDPIVTMQFTGHGNKVFAQVTKNEAQRGASLQQLQSFAIVLDDQIRSWPTIDYTKYPGGINPAGTGAEISGSFTVGEAKDLALVLQTGALPINFVTQEQTNVSATLGKDSLTQAWHAAVGGLIVVCIFLLVLYRFLGLVAVIGLSIYAAFMYAAILIFGVTLTLPGFAGLILTIGVAADANVVVFERIKEEARAGKSVRAAVASGYAKGFHTIVDANVVTAITALILFAVATAEVKGFALMLLIGTAVSLITAVAATRAMLGLLAGFRWFANPRFMGASGAQRARFLQIDFMRRRHLWFAISGVVLLVSAVSLGVRGLNLGIDFKGGVQYTFKTAQPTSLTSVRQQTNAIGQGDAVVQGVGETAPNGDYSRFQIRLKKLNPVQQDRLSSLLTRNVHAEATGVKNVSSSFGRQIARAAIIAILFSLLVITLYIWVRFKGLSFAIPVIVAMLHDVAITVGIYSLTGREVTSSTVAAVLTVLGYSIYDTIIIFDRIRENIPLMRRAPFAAIANVSLWETIRRSLATTFITLLPVLSLLFFGGATLKDFAFALLIGITAGAYSSVFVAAPLLAIAKERDPEYARRKGRETPDDLDGSVSGPAARTAAPKPKTVEAVGAGVGAPSDGDAAAVSREDKRERRRQRRQSRPHGRPR